MCTPARQHIAFFCGAIALNSAGTFGVRSAIGQPADPSGSDARWCFHSPSNPAPPLRTVGAAPCRGRRLVIVDFPSSSETNVCSGWPWGPKCRPAVSGALYSGRLMSFRGRRHSRGRRRSAFELLGITRPVGSGRGCALHRRRKHRRSRFGSGRHDQRRPRLILDRLFLLFLSMRPPVISWNIATSGISPVPYVEVPSRIRRGASGRQGAAADESSGPVVAIRVISRSDPRIRLFIARSRLRATTGPGPARMIFADAHPFCPPLTPPWRFRGARSPRQAPGRSPRPRSRRRRG